MGLMESVYPVFDFMIKNGFVSIEDISRLLNLEYNVIVAKLSGEDDFDINEAMMINKNLLPDIPFEKLFSRD